ncbi:hypothetical protein [Pendulispora albinea]|uniref:STAS/SEC14 domain-containing protein n=1 Tax=Pendulispora albinea TaxID=2741071 RepID=A0ABZ2MBL7_9BACT
MYSVKNRVGRLVEAWVATPVSLEDANRIFIDARTCVSSVAANGYKVVVVADMTQVSLFPPEISDKLLQIMRGDTPHLERGGYWIGEALPMFSLQIQRMIREAGSTQRRIFTRRATMETWLADILAPHERRRLTDFLDGREKELAALSTGGTG